MSLFDEDELNVPPWISEDFFEMILRKHANVDNIKINSCAITSASIKGDHYVSILFRCKINFNYSDSRIPQQTSFMVKTLPDEGIKADIMLQTKAFENEINMYTETLTQIERILKECGEPTKLAAEIIYHSLSPRRVIVFEDLRISGYGIMRDRSLAEAELHVAYSKVAKLHAVSFMLAQRAYPECVTKYDEGLFSNSAITSMVLISTGIHKFIDLVSKHAEFRKYWPKIKALQPDMFNKCKSLFNAYRLNEPEIFVLNHGDRSAYEKLNV